MKIGKEEYPGILDRIDELARAKNYSKIFAKVPAWAKPRFDKEGYKKEAYIPNFFSGREDAFFMAKYLDAFRARKSHPELISKVIDTANKAETVEAADLHPGSEFHYSLLTPEDVREMADVYKTVFETYPFPIHDPDYLASTMKDNFVYFGIRAKGRLVAISSCEMDAHAKNVEMTDFATLPEYRSKGLASFLLMKMEKEMRQRGIITAYTIARAESYGMNIVFAKHGYMYSGTLVKNTNIYNKIESMNVWYKSL